MSYLVKVVGLKRIGIRQKIGIGNGITLSFHRDRGGKRIKIILKERKLLLENGSPLLLENGKTLILETKIRN